MVATEKKKCILTHYLDLVNKNYKDIPPEKEIILGSFLASENSQESKASNSVQILVVKRTASRKKEEPVSKDKNTDIWKWFKKKETSTVVKDDRKAEKDKTVVVIDWFFEPEQWLSNMKWIWNYIKKLVFISYFVVDTIK